MAYPDTVSIVIPCHNGEEFIADAISSALDQSYPCVEVIVIDDGSTDRSLEVIQSFGHRIRWETGPNRGACAARNQGVARAQGAWVQFLDADDELHPSKIERQLPHAREAIDARKVSICFGTVEPADQFLAWQYRRPYDEGRDPVDFLLSGIVQTSAPLHPIDWLRKVGGFDESLPCAQEWDLHLRLAAQGLGIRQMRDALFKVRRRSGSISSDGLKVVRQRLPILIRLVGLLSATGALTDLRRTAIAVNLVQSAHALERSGDVSMAMEFRDVADALDADSSYLAWSPRWRNLVRILGHGRAEKLRRWKRKLRESLSR
jgi:glycosyltransferase involved in cell wall biosynthesis